MPMNFILENVRLNEFIFLPKKNLPNFAHRNTGKAILN